MQGSCSNPWESRQMSPSNSTCGEDLSFSTEFYAIHPTLRFDDPPLDQGEWVSELKVFDWPDVERMDGITVMEPSLPLHKQAQQAWNMRNSR